jgi:DNA-binding transcriptional MocR family regulator
MAKRVLLPGQDRIAADTGMSRSRVTEFTTELEKADLISIRRRGQVKTNIYTVHFRVKKKALAKRPTGRCWPADIRMSTTRPPNVDQPNCCGTAALSSSRMSP